MREKYICSYDFQNIVCSTPEWWRAHCLVNHPWTLIFVSIPGSQACPIHGSLEKIWNNIKQINAAFHKTLMIVISNKKHYYTEENNGFKMPTESDTILVLFENEYALEIYLTVVNKEVWQAAKSRQPFCKFCLTVSQVGNSLLHGWALTCKDFPYKCELLVNNRNKSFIVMD